MTPRVGQSVLYCHGRHLAPLSAFVVSVVADTVDLVVLADRHSQGAGPVFFARDVMVCVGEPPADAEGDDAAWAVVGEYDFDAPPGSVEEFGGRLRELAAAFGTALSELEGKVARLEGLIEAQADRLASIELEVTQLTERAAAGDAERQPDPPASDDDGLGQREAEQP